MVNREIPEDTRSRNGEVDQGVLKFRKALLAFSVLAGALTQVAPSFSVIVAAAFAVVWFGVFLSVGNRQGVRDKIMLVFMMGGLLLVGGWVGRIGLALF